MRPRTMEVISPALHSESLARTPLEQYVIWTGREAAGQRGSLRLRAFACIREVGQPVSLRTLIQRAARLDGLCGLDPDAVRSGVRLHQIAKPAVLFLAERRASGEFVAVADIPYAGAMDRRILAGEVLIDVRGVRRFDAVPCAA